MTPMQQIFLGMGAVATKTYVDDVFSTYLWKGTGSARSINNGVDLSGEGGMTWIKKRDQSGYSNLYDTTRGVTKYLVSNESDAEATVAQGLTAFNNNGFSLGTSGFVNTSNGDTYASWTFRKAPGFCDVVTFTTSDPTISNRRISHNLGCVPGMIILKNRDDAEDWLVYHRHLGTGKYLRLNLDNDASTFSNIWGSSAPTSSDFGFNESGWTYANKDYVAYVFAGGASTAATARSVDFDGSDDYLDVPSSSDFNFGTGDFTWEFWINPDVQQGYILCFNGDDGFHFVGTNQKLAYFNTTTGTSSVLYTGNGKLPIGQWSHVAACRSSGTTRIFINGTQTSTASDSHNYPTNELTIGDYSGHTGASGHRVNGKISNVRIIKGTALYTSSFKPPTEPLTNVTNTKLLCCNNSSVTGSTVSPTTITAASSPTASTDSPFDDPAAFTFGDSKEGVIKCGSYVGNGNDGSADGNVNGPKITLGFEPAWLLIKRSTANEDWQIYDCMRGIPSNTGTKKLAPNNNDSESGNLNYLRLSADGFQLATANQQINADGDTYCYLAIRRSDGYVGKPVELGTGVFAMDTGNSSTTVPTYDSGFPVDMALRRATGSTANWFLSARLIQARDLKPNLNNAEGGNAAYLFDSNVGWNYNGDDTDYQSWMFKRHAGMDVVCYDGNSVAGRQIPHSLSKTPEMVWCKMRDHVDNWHVYHLGANGGSNPQDYMLKLNSNEAEANTANFWNDTAPTSTHFTIGSDGGINSSSRTYIALLFSSVSGISKCGFYTGNGAYGTNTISTGFAPRFVIIKQTDSAKDWVVLDTTRGWASGSDKYLLLNKTDAEANWDHGAPTSTGFTLGSDDMVNGDTNKYVYYAHA